MIKFTFYLFGLFAIWYEIYTIANWKKFTALSKKIEGADKLPEKDRPKLTSTETGAAFLMVGYFLWTFVGLFTSQWIVFVGLFVLGFLTMAINNIKRTKAWNIIDSMASIFLIMYAILNTYHLHNDTWKIVWNFIADN